MANEILSPSAMPLGTSFRRNVNEPLDTSSVFPLLSIAETYAHNIANNENYCPYDGQIITVRHGSDNESHIYKLVPATGEEDWLDGYDTSKDYNADGILNKFHYNLIEILGADRTLDTKEGGTVDGLVNFDGGATATNLLVTGTLQVNEVNINHIKHSGGVFLNTRANIVVSEVTELTGADLGKTKLTFTRTAGSQTIYNLFEVGDFALSMMFNLKETEGYQIGNDGSMTWNDGDGETLIDVVRYYWREVVAVGSDYITLGAVPNNVNMSAPKVGDNVVQLGNNTNDVSRQGCQVMGYSKINGVFIAEYDGLTTNIQSSKAQSLALKVFDDYDKAIVYLSPKKHKLQGDEILLKSGNQYIQLAEKLTAMANDISLKASQADLNIANGNITANANAIVLKADNKWLLKMTKDSAGMYVIGENGQPVANGGRMVLVANSDGSIGAVTIASNGTMTYTENFTLKASNVDFTAGAINMNTAKFVIGTDTNVTLFQSGKIKTDYIDVNTLKAALINAGIINAEQIVANALTATASFNADGATIANLKVTGNSVFQGHLNGVDGTFSGNLDAVGGTFQGSISIANGKILIDGNEVNGVTNDGTQMHIGVNGLIAKAANTLNQYLLANTGGIEMRWGDDGIKLSGNGLQRYINGGWVDMFAKPRTRAISGATTLTLQDQNIIVRGGSDFNITLPAGAPNGMQIMIKHTQVDSSVKIVPNTGQQISPTDEGNGKRLYNTDCCWLTMLDSVWYWNYAEV